VLNRIAHKHASVGLKPAHYPIVGRHLLKAIEDVLGSAATPELIAAWDEAYWLLAGELIAAESRLYDRSGTVADQRLPMRVTERVQQADNIVSLTLEPVPGGELKSFLPGQYVSVVVELSPNVFQQRQYSLSDAPNGKSWRISVRRAEGQEQAPDGAVSSWIHAHVQVGDTLMVSQPFGDFAPVLDGEGPIALLSAGVGITPMVSSLNTLAQKQSKRPVVFGYAVREASHLAHLDDLAAAMKQLPDLHTHLYLESGEDFAFNGVQGEAGRMDAGQLLVQHPALINADFYLCGPLPFMQAQRAALLDKGVPEAKIHREVFGPDLLDHLL